MLLFTGGISLVLKKYYQQDPHALDTLAKLNAKLTRYDFIAQYLLKKQISQLEAQKLV